MNWIKLNKNIEKSDLYIFAQRHKKVINIIQGFFIIGLLIGINIYVVQDHYLKKQIAERCGYTTVNYECVCEKNYVDNYKELERGSFVLNLSDVDNVDS